MGLDCSHDAYSGGYIGFNFLRAAVCSAAGGKWPEGFGNSVIELPHNFEQDYPGLMVFFLHSDCDGEISPEDCEKVAKDLIKMLPRVDARFRDDVNQFAKGCEAAHAANEPLVFG